MNDWAGKLFYISLFLPAFVSALTVHEFAHAWAADRLGDDTPRREGRLTLDPLAHLDPLGSVLILFSLWVGFPLIGFAKPVPFNPRNLRNPRRDAVLIAIAGPISNLLQLVVWFVLLFAMRFIAQRADPEFAFFTLSALDQQPIFSNMASIVGAVLATGIVVNLGLALFNMIPIPPLDGHYVLEGFGPPFITDLYNAIRPWSFVVLYLLLWTGVIATIMAPVSRLASQMVALALGLPVF